MSGGKASKLKPRPRRTLPSAVIIGSSGKPRVTLESLGTPSATLVLNNKPQSSEIADADECT